MSIFRIRYQDPATEERLYVVSAYSDWTGRAKQEGAEVGPVLTITAEEWAKDEGYSLADKGWHEVELLDEQVRGWRKAGWSVGEIATKLGVKRDDVREVLKDTLVGSGA